MHYIGYLAITIEKTSLQHLEKIIPLVSNQSESVTEKFLESLPSLVKLAAKDPVHHKIILNIIFPLCIGFFYKNDIFI